MPPATRHRLAQLEGGSPKRPEPRWQNQPREVWELILSWLDQLLAWHGWTAILAIGAFLTLLVFWGQLREMNAQRQELQKQGDEARHRPVTPLVWLSTIGPQSTGMAGT